MEADTEVDVMGFVNDDVASDDGSSNDDDDDEGNAESDNANGSDVDDDRGKDGSGKGSSSDLEGSLFSGASISSIDTLFNSESLLPNKSLDGEGIGDDEEDFCFNNRRNWLASIISACFGGKYEGGGSDDSMCPGFKFLTSSSFT